MPHIIKFPQYKLREDSAVTISPSLRAILDWDIGDECELEVDITNPDLPKLVIIARKHLESSVNNGQAGNNGQSVQE